MLSLRIRVSFKGDVSICFEGPGANEASRKGFKNGAWTNEGGISCFRGERIQADVGSGVGAAFAVKEGVGCDPVWETGCIFAKFGAGAIKQVAGARMMKVKNEKSNSI